MPFWCAIKQIFEISASFDQRIEIDSLIPNNVIILNSQSEPIVGEISYDESNRQMKFFPASNLPVDDLISVKWSGIDRTKKNNLLIL